MLQTALDHYERQQQITAEALVRARREKDNPQAAALIIAYFQLRAAQDALDSIEGMLDEQGIVAPLIATLFAQAFAGSSNEGLPLDTLIALLRDLPDFAFDRAVVTQIQDAARQAAITSITAREAELGYVRMLNPPSCSRCVVLAGKFYRFNEGFERHPKCDCRHVPSIENLAGDLTTNPDTYFHSLSPAEQDRVFTKAGAEAIREGADISQVVNARAGMSTAQSGRIARGAGGFFTTTAGTTRRGTFGRSNTAGRARLMPESIIELAGGDHAEAQRLLRLYRYIL